MRHNKFAFFPSVEIGKWLKKQPTWLRTTLTFLENALRALAIIAIIILIWKGLR